MRIALGFDHRGNEAGAALARHLRSAGHEVDILGETGPEPRDYPDSAWLVGRAVAQGHAERGILICGSGIGVCIAANKIDGIRAALVLDERSAEMSRSHNDANVICLSSDVTAQEAINAITDIWLATGFEGGRHARRVEKIKAMEHGMDPRDMRDVQERESLNVGKG